MTVPHGLLWWREDPEGAAWLDRLERLVDECLQTWSLRLERPYDLRVAYVAAVRLPDGRPAVLKLNKPEDESADEGGALLHWGGAGAVRLLAEDATRNALLLERCEPGYPLRRLPEPAALDVAAGILRGFRRPADVARPLRPLSKVAAQWAQDISERWTRFGEPYERTLLDFALDQIAELTSGASEEVVLHQDLHAENILRADREPWLAIDPKPLLGDPAFDAASLLRDRRDELRNDPSQAATIRRRLDTLTELLGLDRDRLRGWGVIHALAWAAGTSDADRLLIDCARLLAATP